MTDEQKRTIRDLKGAIIFGLVAAALELAALVYFFR